MLKNDSANFEKYNRLFKHSPMYKNWAEDLRNEFYTKKTNTKLSLEGMPEQAAYNDFFINHGAPEYNFVQLSKVDPKNQQAFEYLIATALLQKKLKTFLSLMDQRYFEIGYEKLPKHIEEALIICKYTIDGSEDAIKRFPISKDTEMEFAQYDKASAAATYPQARENLRKTYGHTYWHYFLNVNPIMLEATQIESRY